MLTATQPSNEQPKSAPSAKHWFLEGNFAPVDDELTLSDLTVRGALPRELSGVLMRNGPNPAGPAPGNHWFVGDGMLHALRIEEGRARGYRNRYVRTPHLESVLGLPAAKRTPYEIPLGSGSIHTIQHAGHVLALGEVGLPYEIDRDANTLRQYDFAGALRSNMTGHPKLDPVTGELFFYGYDFGPTNLRYHIADASGLLTKTLEIPTRAPTMMHDFAVTATHAIFMDFPVVFDMQCVARGQSMPFRWDEDHGARLGVMRRDGDASDLRWYEIPTCYVYHVFNAYDQDGSIVIDLVEHADTFKADEVRENVGSSRCVRWELDLASGRFTRSVLDARGQEFPRIDPRRVTQQHRYGYAVHSPFAVAGPAAFIKHDFERGTSETHALEGGRAPSEGVFVPVGAGEDEGYVLAPVYDPARNASEVHVLDAQRWTRPPVAVIELPVRIPFGFHGDFIANS